MPRPASVLTRIKANRSARLSIGPPQPSNRQHNGV